MSHVRRWVLSAGAALALMLGFAGAGATAHAAPNPAGTTSSTARLSDGQAVDSAAALKKVADYWTPERMRHATPVPEQTPGPQTKALPTRPSGPRGSTPPAKPVASGSISPMITESAVAGKVFFHKPSGGDWVCSASALNSDSKQLVITAGHCVHEGAGGNWMQNWTFVPRYRSGARPFGTFAAKEFRTFNSWISSSDLSRDVGMVTTWPLNGNKLVNVVGGHGLNWNWGNSVAITILGYPANANNGEIQQWCQGTTSDGGGGTIKLQCNFNGGSSGSGWLMNFNDSTGLGQVDGVMSTLDSTGWNRASYFDDAVKAMFDAQGGVT
ncbi:peptidase [Actinoallomurus acanthiterrae]